MHAVKINPRRVKTPRRKVVGAVQVRSIQAKTPLAANAVAPSAPALVLHCVHQMAVTHQRIGHRDRADGVIGIERVRVKEGFEDLRAVVTELVHGVLSRNRRKFRQPINVACPSPGRWGRPNSRVTSRHFDHGNASRMSRPDCSGLDGAD